MDKVALPSHLERYYNQGFALIPLPPEVTTKDKDIPLIKWKDRKERLTREEIAEWCKKTKRWAIVCGEISGNLAVIDIDKEELFSGLNLGVVASKTYVEERKGKFHIYVRPSKPIKNKKLNLPGEDGEEISIRFNDNLIISGYTEHSSGGSYQHFPTSPKEIKTVDVGFFGDLEKIWEDKRGLTDGGLKGFGGFRKGINLKGSILDVIKGCVELKELKDNDETYTCRCPFPKHKDLAPSFSIYKKTNSYYCFGCQKGGNPVTFIADFYGISKKKAIERLKSEGVIEEEKKEEEEFKRKACFERDDRLYLEILTADEQYKFVYLNEKGEVSVIDSIEDILPVELPLTKEGEIAYIVKMPDESIITTELLDSDELLEKVKTHIKKYCDMPDMDVELCAFYILFTWFYKKTNTVGYLRFLGDSGKGKSRFVTVISDICFYPTSTGGSSSFSGLMRTNERWHGTMVMDEGDLRGDKENQVIKYLNAGFEKGKYFILSDKTDPKRQEVFDPFSPKIIGAREHFKDLATEGRLLSISPHETTNEDLVILLNKEYYEDSRTLLNLIARFVLEHWNEVSGEEMIDLKGMGIEPRLKQLIMPLSIISQVWKEGKEHLKNYAQRRQKEIKKDRAQSWHGSLFNLILNIATGEEELGDDYKIYYDEDGEIQAVTPSMIAKTMNTSPRKATEALISIGFVVEHGNIRYYKYNREDETSTEHRKTVRMYVVPDKKTWNEIIQRYYYDEEECHDIQCEITEDKEKCYDSTFKIPEILKSKIFTDPI